MALASWRAADVDRDVAAGRDDPVERAAIDDQILDDGKGLGPPRLDRDRVAVLEPAHVELADRRAAIGPCGTPLTTRLHVPQMPSRQSESNAIGSSPFVDQPFVDDVEHLEERHVGRDVVGV